MAIRCLAPPRTVLILKKSAFYLMTDPIVTDAMLFRTRALLVRQRTQAGGSLRGHLAEFGMVAPRGSCNVGRLRHEPAAAQEAPPEQVAGMAELLPDRIDALSEQIAGLEKEIRTRARERDELKRLMTIPGIGPICAMAVHAFAPPMAAFESGRDFAAWIGLTPRQHSTAGRQRLGRITRTGQRDLGQPLVLDATAVPGHRRQSELQGDPRLARMISGKPPKLVAVALAGKMARMIRALSASEENDRAPAAMAAAK